MFKTFFLVTTKYGAQNIWGAPHPNAPRGYGPDRNLEQSQVLIYSKIRSG